VAGHPGRLRWWDGARWTDEEYVIPGTAADAATRHPSGGPGGYAGSRGATDARSTGPSPRGSMRPDRLGLVASRRQLDGSAIAVLVPTLALLPVSLVALAAFWLPIRLVAPVPYWVVAVGYLAGGVLVFLRPIQRLLLRWLFGARRPRPDELARLAPAWRDVLTQAGLAGDRYVLAVVDSDELNAYACGGHVVAVSTGALDLLPDDELHGVLAHELGHHLGLHTAALSIGHWLSLPIVTLARIGFFLDRVAQALSESFGARVPALAVVGRLVAVVIEVIAYAFLITVLASRAISERFGRSSEFAADRRAVAMGYGPHLALALRRVHAMDQRDGGASDRRLLGGHPSPVLRVARIEAMLRRPARRAP
jgi:Zn-dependent protease with chaperone function